MTNIQAIMPATLDRIFWRREGCGCVVELRIPLPSPITSIPPQFPGTVPGGAHVSPLQGLEPQLPTDDGSCERSL